MKNSLQLTNSSAQIALYDMEWRIHKDFEAFAGHRARMAMAHPNRTPLSLTPAEWFSEFKRFVALG